MNEALESIIKYWKIDDYFIIFMLFMVALNLSFLIWNCMK